MSQFWDERFANKEYVYGHEPNTFFKKTLDELQPGSLLLPCEGEGRNAVYAASQGWDVHAFDSSREGQKKALALAAHKTVSIHYELMDVATFNGDNEQYDAIALIFGHFDPELRKTFHSALINALKPGGKLIIEGFRKEQLGQDSGGPKNIDMLYDKSMLLSDFEGLNVLSIETEDRILNEGPFHQGIGKLIHLIAEKPI